MTLAQLAQRLREICLAVEAGDDTLAANLRFDLHLTVSSLAEEVGADVDGCTDLGLVSYLADVGLKTLMER